MSLFNVDKSSGARLRPSINAQDTVPHRRAHGTDAISNRAENKTGSGRVTQKDDKIVVYQGETPRILIGVDPDDEFNIVVSRPGESVFDVFS